MTGHQVLRKLDKDCLEICLIWRYNRLKILPMWRKRGNFGKGGTPLALLRRIRNGE